MTYARETTQRALDLLAVAQQGGTMSDHHARMALIVLAHAPTTPYAIRLTAQAAIKAAESGFDLGEGAEYVLQMAEAEGYEVERS